MSSVVSTKPQPLPKGATPNLPKPPTPIKTAPEPWSEAERERYWQDAQWNLNYAFHLLTYTSWWIAWRTTVLGSYRIFHDSSEGAPPAYVEMNPTTGKIDMAFNLVFALSLSPGDLAFIFAHETMHFVYDHLGRMKKYQYIWNIATDAVINEGLMREVGWSGAVKHEDRPDWVLNNVIFWNKLPEGVQKKYPIENLNDYTADEIYDAILQDMKQNNVEPEEFEGRVLRRGQRKLGQPQTHRHSGGGSKVVRQKVPLEVGDIVYVKSKGRYGVVKSITRNQVKVHQSDVDVEFKDNIPDDVMVAVAKNSKSGKFDPVIADALMKQKQAQTASLKPQLP